MINAAAQAAGIAEFVQKYKAFKTDPKHKYVDTEAAVNRFGYTLLRNNKVADAVEIFKLNAESYPNSANVYDSLGDALQAAGNKAEAIKSYEKALSIDPNYASSRDSNEALCMVVAHNIVCLIQAMFEFGVKPDFWKSRH